MPIVQAISAPLAGMLQSRLNRYIEIHAFGFGIWALGAALLISCDENTHAALFCFFTTLIGTGIGCVLQPTIIALQAHCSKAVVISSRNFLRNSGGAVGLALSTAVATKTFETTLPHDLGPGIRSIFAAPGLSQVSITEQAAIKRSCEMAIRTVFILCASFMGVCFLFCGLVKDRGLVRPEEREVEGARLRSSTENADKQGRSSNPDLERAALVTSDTIMVAHIDTSASSLSVNDLVEEDRDTSRWSLKSMWSMLRSGE